MADTLTITDNRTGRQYEVPITDGTIRAIDLRQIKVEADEFGLLSYDPAFLNTANCRSSITFIDGDKGILRYRGYPIEQLAEQSSFVETAWLLLNGELPAKEELAAWTAEIGRHVEFHENVKRLVEAFRHDAHPMGVFLSVVGALSTFFPDAKRVLDAESRRTQIARLIAQVPAVAACTYRHGVGRPYVAPDPDLSYAGNFLSMLYRGLEREYRPDPVLERALDVLFILHADHEQNCSTSAMRGIGSSQADPFAALAGAAAALYGPLHGGANEAVLRMLAEIGSVDQIPEFIRSVKAGRAATHGIRSPRLQVLRPARRGHQEAAHRVFEVTGRNPLLDVALELERIALQDDYFVGRRLYPNVDFYSGLIYEAMGLRPGHVPGAVRIGRTAGGVAQWQEMLEDKEQRIARPRQIYTGAGERDYVALDAR